jgi:hypothetical protein
MTFGPDEGAITSTQPPSALAHRTTSSTNGTDLWGIVHGRVGAGHDTAAQVIVDELYSQGDQILTLDVQTGPT